MGVIARQSIKGALANYLGVAIGFFVSFFVLTRYLTQEEIGLTRVMVDAALLFSSLAQLGTNSSVVRFFPYFKDAKGNHGIFGLSVLVPLAGFALFALAFLVFREPLLAVYAKNSPLVADYFYLVPMLTFFALYTTVFETNASVLMRITVPKLVREVGIRLFNLAAYLLYGYGLISLDVFVWLFCGSYGLAMLLNLAYLTSLGHISFRVDWKSVKPLGGEMLRYSLFMTVTVLAGNIPLFNSLFLGAKAGLALTGVYTIASYIANVVEVPYRSLGAISRPVIATAVKEERWDEVNRLGRQVSLHQLLVSTSILYLIYVNLDTLFALIPNGEAYAGGKTVVLLLGLAKVVNSSFSVCTDILNFSRQYRWSLLYIVLLTATALGLNSQLPESEDAIDVAAAATLTAYAAYFILLFRHLYVHLGHISVFSRGQAKVVAIMAAMSAVYLAWSSVVEPALPLGPIAMAVVRTAVLGGMLAAAVCLWQVSPTVNSMAKGMLHKK
ncbi:MAG: lipopolysaccharide biosynthesis protein [Bacteroidales bacterium]|nr:lipopolysaccharide biosynthesis protein [Bacteroidales bacterium]